MRLTLRVLATAALTVPLLMVGVGPARRPPPANDDISNAVEVGALPFTASQSTVEATSAVDGDCGNINSVWYRFTPQTDLTAAINTFGSADDTVLGVYAGSPGALTTLGCNDDSFGTLQSSVRQAVTAGTTYFIAVTTCCGSIDPGLSLFGGDLVLNVQEAPPALTTDVTAARSATVGKTGVVRITGTITCNRVADVASVNVQITQVFARNRAEGSAGINVACGPSPTAWTVEVVSFTSTRFGGGKATVSVQAFAQSPDSFAFDEVTKQTVTLKGNGN